MKYDNPSPDTAHQHAKDLIEIMRRLGGEGHFHIVKTASGTGIAELHANEVGAAELQRFGIGVEVDPKLRGPYNHQIQLTPLYGHPGAEKSLRGLLINQVNFTEALAPALALDRENHAARVTTERLNKARAERTTAR